LGSQHTGTVARFSSKFQNLEYGMELCG
jgi:hypothetical protein